MASHIQHKVPSLSAEVKGEVEEGIACFRGLPYATLEKRWTHSSTLHKLPSQFDASSYGPRCSQGHGMVLVTGGVNDPTPGDDEFSCLNLNVAVPEEALESGRSLPVMVWIHGGAFNYGCNSVARYRPVQLSKIALADGNPVVIVAIQYRLGPLGFIASSDLKTEHAPASSTIADGDRHTPNSTFGNFGFVDQIHALEWVRDHIADFGGNPHDVTVFGVSAGSASIHHHILTREPLFDRAIMMSGSAPTLGPLPFAVYEQAWANLVKNAGIDGDTPAKRLEQLRSLTPDEIIKFHSKAPLGPMADGELLPLEWDYAAVQTLTRCKSIIIGDTQVEAIIMDGLIDSVSQENFLAIVESSIKDPPAFLAAFAFRDLPNMEPMEYKIAMRAWLSLGMFQYPGLLVAKTYPGSTYFYHFDEPSPYPGPTYGIPYHGQCALFMYCNGLEEYPVEAKETAERMAHLWTGFANGKAPWEDYKEGSRFLRLGPQGKASVQTMESDKVRSYGWAKWTESHYEELKDLTRLLTIKP